MRNRIRRALQEYAADSSAHANGVTQLVGLTAKRMRIGNFRAIFEEAGDDILVTRIGPRGSVYDE